MGLNELRTQLVAAYQSNDEAKISELEGLLATEKTNIKATEVAKAKAEFDALTVKRVEVASALAKAIKNDKCPVDFVISIENLKLAHMLLSIDGDVISKVETVRGTQVAYTRANADVAGSIASVALATVAKAKTGNGGTHATMLVTDDKGNLIGLEATYQQFKTPEDVAAFDKAAVDHAGNSKAINSAQWQVKNKVRNKAIANGLLKPQA